MPTATIRSLNNQLEGMTTDEDSTHEYKTTKDDYYAILEIHCLTDINDVTHDQITEAYEKIWNHRIYVNDSNRQGSFKRIHTAFHVLSGEQRRYNYDCWYVLTFRRVYVDEAVLAKEKRIRDSLLRASEVTILAVETPVEPTTDIPGSTANNRPDHSDIPPSYDSTIRAHDPVSRSGTMSTTSSVAVSYRTTEDEGEAPPPTYAESSNSTGIQSRTTTHAQHTSPQLTLPDRDPEPSAGPNYEPLVQARLQCMGCVAQPMFGRFKKGNSVSITLDIKKPYRIRTYWFDAIIGIEFMNLDGPSQLLGAKYSHHADFDLKAGEFVIALKFITRKYLEGVQFGTNKGRISPLMGNRDDGNVEIVNFGGPNKEIVGFIGTQDKKGLRSIGVVGVDSAEFEI